MRYLQNVLPLLRQLLPTPFEWVYSNRPTAAGQHHSDREVSMAQLNEYDVVINGMATTVLLTEDQAKARGIVADKNAEPARDKKAPAPRGKKK